MILMFIGQGIVGVLDGMFGSQVGDGVMFVYDVCVLVQKFCVSGMVVMYIEYLFEYVGVIVLWVVGMLLWFYDCFNGKVVLNNCWLMLLLLSNLFVFEMLYQLLLCNVVNGG